MNWILLSLLSALATSLTTILAKIGIKNVNSNFATFYRTGIVIIFAFIMVLITGGLGDFTKLSFFNWIFLILSGVATGASWLTYYRALQLGDVNKVAPIDKSSFVLSSILFFIFFFDDSTNHGNPLTISMLIISLILMLSGTLLMVEYKKWETIKKKSYLFYAILSAVFASLVSFFIKIGLQGISSSLGTLIRTIIVFIFSFGIVLSKKSKVHLKSISLKSWIFLSLSGIATGIAWLSEYSAYNIVNSNPVAINAINKLAILSTMLFSFIILKEKFSKKSLLGLGLLTSGIVLIIIFSL